MVMQVPWANLGRSPVLVSIDRLYILAGPKSEVSTGEKEQYEVVYRPSHPRTSHHVYIVTLSLAWQIWVTCSVCEAQLQIVTAWLSPG